MKIIHISDLHFGTERPGIVNVLTKDILLEEPDIIVVSGDLTQRAKTDQFKKARAFLNEFNNVLVVPGNHDISLYNPIERLIYPFSKYKQLISTKIPMSFITEKIKILGINSVMRFKPMGGFITRRELAYILNFFNIQSSQIKIIVMHHNLIRSQRHSVINHADYLINAFSSVNINLVLAGHIHAAHIELLKRKFLNYNMYVITAGSAISTRTYEANSYNVIEVNMKEFKLTVKSYHFNQFIITYENVFSF